MSTKSHLPPLGSAARAASLSDEALAQLSTAELALIAARARHELERRDTDTPQLLRQAGADALGATERDGDTCRRRWKVGHYNVEVRFAPAASAVRQVLLIDRAHFSLLDRREQVLDTECDFARLGQHAIDIAEREITGLQQLLAVLRDIRDRGAQARLHVTSQEEKKL